MEAKLFRFDAHYEVYFSRPAFSRIASFVQIIEPIYDAFISETPISPDAIELENGNTLDTAGVILNLFSGLSVFEAKLDGYKTHFYKLWSPESIERAKRHTKLFESAICSFLVDVKPGFSKINTFSWLTLEGGETSADNLVRNLTWQPESYDPFQIGSTKTRSLVKFECSNTVEKWTVGVVVDRSALPEAHLYLEISSEYQVGTQFDDFDKKANHINSVAQSVFNKLGLVLE